MRRTALEKARRTHVSVLGRWSAITALALSGAGAHAQSAEHACHTPAISATNVSWIDYFTGDGHYMPRVHCMTTAEGTSDWTWIWILLTLTAGVVVAYLRIFAFWIRRYYAEEARDRNRKLIDLAMTFLVCAICGYAMSILMFFWPGYRLLAFVLLALNFFAWKFCVNLKPFASAFQSGRFERQLREEVETRAASLESALEARAAQLHASEQRFRSLMQNLPGAAFRLALDSARTPLYISDGVQALTGYTGEEFTGGQRLWGSIIHRDDRPLVEHELRRAVTEKSAYAVEYRIVHRSGETRWVAERGQVITGEDNADCIDGLQIDITSRKLAEDALRRASMHDKLTGLPNRVLLMDRLRQALLRRERDSARHAAVLFIDFDRFKIINDSLGHEGGDELLRQIARRLRSALRPEDTVVRDTSNATAGRLGGDEFLVILENIKHPEAATLIAHRLLDVCRDSYTILGHEVQSTASIGIATTHTCRGTAEELLRDADIAMYQAKLAGKDRAVMFDAAMRDQGRERLLLEEELRSAVRNSQLRVVYQPIVALDTARCVGVEALVRWDNPRRGVVSPAEFIPIAEEAGLVTAIGEWVLREATEQLARWIRDLGDLAPTTMSVNLSRAQLACTDLPEKVTAIIQRAKLPPERIQLELTENQAANSMAAQAEALRRLRLTGVRLAMDDFGTGMSSLAGLHELPIDVLKIDRSFVRNLARGKQFMALARSIIDLSANLGLKTVAEGIETEGDLAVLQALGCEFGQGYFFSPPITAEQFEQFARHGPERHSKAA